MSGHRRSILLSYPTKNSSRSLLSVNSPGSAQRIRVKLTRIRPPRKFRIRIRLSIKRNLDLTLFRLIIERRRKSIILMYYSDRSRQMVANPRGVDPYLDQTFRNKTESGSEPLKATRNQIRNPGPACQAS